MALAAQNPIPNTQYPIPNTQYPIPNTQYPIPNTQESCQILTLSYIWKDFLNLNTQEKSWSMANENALKNTAWLFSILMLVPEKLNVRFSSSFRLKTTFRLIYIKQFVEACHRCDYTSVEAGRLKTHLMLSLTKISKIINFVKQPGQFYQKMCHQ